MCGVEGVGCVAIRRAAIGGESSLLWPPTRSGPSQTASMTSGRMSATVVAPWVGEASSAQVFAGISFLIAPVALAVVRNTRA